MPWKPLLLPPPQGIRYWLTANPGAPSQEPLMLWPLLPLLLLLIARRLPLTQPVYPWCSPPSWSCASIWHLSYMPVSKLQKSLGSRFFWALPQKGIIPRSEKSPSMRHALHLLQTVLIYVSLYFFRLSIKLFLSPPPPRHLLIRPEIPQSLIFYFHFSRNMAHSKCQTWPWTWMIISIQNTWLTSTGISKGWPFPGKKKREPVARYKEWTWGVREWRRVNRRIFLSRAQSLLISLFCLFEEKIHVGNATWNKMMQSRVHKSTG